MLIKLFQYDYFNVNVFSQHQIFKVTVQVHKLRVLTYLATGSDFFTVCCLITGLITET